jgi:protein O-mannosyl-transferase
MQPDRIPKQGAPESSSPFVPLLICCLLALATITVFLPVYHYDFVSVDDPDYVTENSMVARGLTWEGALWAFRSGHASNWHPLTWLSHMLDCQMQGLKPGGHHFTSMLIHTANALLLFLVLSRMTSAPWRSAFVAGLFALHPLHVESVAWVTERKDVLSSLFFMLTLWAYVRYAEISKTQIPKAPGNPKPEARSPKAGIWYCAALGLFALGLMSKPMVVTLPFVLLLLDYWPLRRLERSSLDPRGWSLRSRMWGLLLEKAPFLALSVLSSLVTILAQRRGGAMVSIEDIALDARCWNALVSYLRYADKLLWPQDLVVVYPYVHEWPSWLIGLAAALLLGTTSLLLKLRRQAPYLSVGWFWYLGMLVPVIGLIQVGGQSMADRYTYLPFVGIFIMLAWSARDLLGTWRFCRVVLGAAAALTLACCALVTHFQIRHWKSSEALFRHAVEVMPANPIAQIGLGTALDEQGRLREAVNCFSAVLQVNRMDVNAHYNLANSLARIGELQDAADHYTVALQLSPGFAKAEYNLATVLARQEKFDEAIRHYRAAVQLEPNYPEAYNNLGNALYIKGELTEAASHLRFALRLRPDFAEAHLNLGNVLLAQGSFEHAHREYLLALQIKPDYASAYSNLAEVLVKDGRPREAIARYREALQLQPDWPEALKNCAWLLATQNDPELRNGTEAVQLAERAAALTGGKQSEVLDVLAAAYAEAGRFSDAADTGLKASRLAESSGQAGFAKKIQERLRLYESREPFRE